MRQIEADRWIPDDVAIEGRDRSQFVESVLRRFCGPLINNIQTIEGDVGLTTDFRLATDPSQISVVDQLIATLLGYNWSQLGMISCTDRPERDELDAISRFEYTKAKDFLENWLRTEGYRCLSMGPRSKSYRVNLIETVEWKDGILIGREANSPQDFYQINRAFTKISVNELMHTFADEIWSSSNPFDFARKISKVCIYKLNGLVYIYIEHIYSKIQYFKKLKNLKRSIKKL